MDILAIFLKQIKAFKNIYFNKELLNQLFFNNCNPDIQCGWYRNNMWSLSGDSVSYLLQACLLNFCVRLCYIFKWSLAGVTHEKHSEVSSWYSGYSFCSCIPLWPPEQPSLNLSSEVSSDLVPHFLSLDTGPAWSTWPSLKKHISSTSHIHNATFMGCACACVVRMNACSCDVALYG